MSPLWDTAALMAKMTTTGARINPAADCSDCRLGQITVSCPKKGRDGEDCAICLGTGKRLHRRSVVWGEMSDGSKPKSAALMCIGEAPGNQEDLTGRPFFPDAPAGRILRGALDKAGVVAYLTNLARCRPPDNKLSAYPDAMTACRRWLDAEMAFCSPRVILLLGALPGSLAFPGLKAHELSGLARSIRGGDGKIRIYVGAFHPAYVARGVDETAGPALERAVGLAVELARSNRRDGEEVL